MSEAEAPAKPAPAAALATTGAPARLEQPKKLDDVLMAMDVVDTLRHRERVVDEELDAEARETQLIGRLKEIYTAQGIEVPDRILKDGVKALAEQRFIYKPPAESFNTKMARLYVNRGRWGPGTLALSGGVAVLAAGWFFLWQLPQAEAWRKLPVELVQLSKSAQSLATDPAVGQRIVGMQHQGEQALADHDRKGALAEVRALRDINTELGSEYSVRIVDRPGEDSIVYRIPHSNRLGRNYYLVVEAVAPDGHTLTLPVTNEETQKTERVSKWAQRVSQEEFDKISSEKHETQIISNSIIGHKARGELSPTYDIDTPGGAITHWQEKK